MPEVLRDATLKVSGVKPDLQIHRPNVAALRIRDANLRSCRSGDGTHRAISFRNSAFVFVFDSRIHTRPIDRAALQDVSLFEAGAAGHLKPGIVHGGITPTD